MPVSVTSGLVPAFPLTFPDTSEAVRLIVVPNTPGPTVTYQLSGGESLQVQSVSADVDTNAAGGSVQVQVDLVSQGGALLARSRTGAGIDPGTVGEVTFAVQLPDSSTLPSPASSTDIQAGLWETGAADQASIVVTALDAAAIILEARLWVRGTAETEGDAKALSPLLAHVPL